MLANEAVLNGGGFYFRAIRTQVKVTGTTFADNMARELAVLNHFVHARATHPLCTWALVTVWPLQPGRLQCMERSFLWLRSVSHYLCSLQLSHAYPPSPLVRRVWGRRRCVRRDVVRSRSLEWLQPFVHQVYIQGESAGSAGVDAQ